MARCPACDHDVRTPFFANLEGWAHLACPHCKARLEMKPPRFALLAPLMAPLFVLARQGRIFAFIAYAYTFATLSLMIVESLLPKVQLRKKAPPKPKIRLNLDFPLN